MQIIPNGQIIVSNIGIVNRFVNAFWYINIYILLSTDVIENFWWVFLDILLDRSGQKYVLMDRHAYF